METFISETSKLDCTVILLDLTNKKKKNTPKALEKSST